MRKYLIIIILSIFFSGTSYSQLAKPFNISADKATGEFKIAWIEKNMLDADENLYRISISEFEQVDARLFIRSDAAFHIFSNSKLIKKSSPDFVFDESIENLKKIAGADSIDVLLNNKAKALYYGVYQKLDVKASEGTDLEITTVESTNQLSNTFIILLIAFSVLLVSLKLSFSKRFQDVFSVSRNFSFRPFEGDNLRLRLFDQDGIFLSIIYTFATATIIYLYFLPSNAENNNAGENYEVVLEFLRAWGAILVLLVLKLVLIFTMSILYRSGRINTFYIKELLNISTFLITLLLVFTAAVYLFNGFLPNVWWTLARNILVLFYIIRVFLVYFKILKLSGFTNVYLFSYFCTTEIFPFVIGLKYFY